MNRAIAKDYFGDEIRVGNTYFCGNPPQHGYVIKIVGKAIMLDIGADRRGVNRTMMVRSPRQGVILERAGQALSVSSIKTLREASEP